MAWSTSYLWVQHCLLGRVRTAAAGRYRALGTHWLSRSGSWIFDTVLCPVSHMAHQCLVPGWASKAVEGNGIGKVGIFYCAIVCGLWLMKCQRDITEWCSYPFTYRRTKRVLWKDRGDASKSVPQSWHLRASSELPLIGSKMVPIQDLTQSYLERKKRKNFTIKGRKTSHWTGNSFPEEPTPIALLPGTHPAPGNSTSHLISHWGHVV